MDPRQNPYAPGAGSPPPELAGRDDLREAISIAIDRSRAGRSARSLLMVGLRGVGKTVLLEQARRDAEASGVHTVKIEAKEDRSLPAVLLPELRKALLRLSDVERAKGLAVTALRAIASLVGAFKMQYEDVTVALDYEPKAGLADSADLEDALRDLLLASAAAASAAGTSLVVFVDELQYVNSTELAALIASLHAVNQAQQPLLLVGAGLPSLRANAGKAKSYAERLFDFPTVDRLSPADAASALVNPARDEGVDYDADAIGAIVEETEGYPFFLQVWGTECWNSAALSPITLEDVRRARKTAIADLDASFFKVRFDRMTPSEKQYLRAMAELGPGPHRSGDIAELLDMAVTSVAPRRNKLIAKGMIWSPSHGDTAFTVPLFDGFMKRIMPGDRWKSGV
ncbi:MAG: AAA family ATPase [Planctomycetota bacterium]